MKLPSSVIEAEEALKLGYKPLTTPYYLPRERNMLDRTQRDLRGVDYILVGTQKAPEIWRRNMISMTETCAIKMPLDPIAVKTTTV